MTLEFEKKYAGSVERLKRSRRVLAAGVSSGLRAAAKPFPLFFSSGRGSRLTDVDGHEFLDYTLAWGPLILGHCPEALNAAVNDQLGRLQQVGAQHDLEWQVAEQICSAVPCADQVVYSNTGTEALQTAIRLARGYTGRNRIIRFEGHYHGWVDNALFGYRPAPESPGSARLALPSAGVNPQVRDEIIVLPWNDADAVLHALQLHGDEVACIITEPILCNSGCLLPKPGYLERLRQLATEFGAVLIFDEVITGFRVAPGTAQVRFDVTPDLATFAKAIAAGLPLSAVAGKREIMQQVEDRKVVHAGTYNGNAVSLAAAHATLQILLADDGAVLQAIESRGERLMSGISARAQQAGIPLMINGVGAVFCLAFTAETSTNNYADTLQWDAALRERFLLEMLEEGVYLLPDGRWYVSAAHTEADVTETLEKVDRVFSRMSSGSSK